VNIISSENDMTLDEWVASNCLGLALDVATHIKQYIADKQEVEDLLRLIMISVRERK